jgi:hypothetical protein
MTSSLAPDCWSCLLKRKMCSAACEKRIASDFVLYGIPGTEEVEKSVGSESKPSRESKKICE